MEIDDYDVHSNLVEKFIIKGDKNAFRKMLNMSLNNTISKNEKKKENIIKRQQFLKSMRARQPPQFHNHNFHLNNLSKNYNTYKNNEVNNLRLDLHNFIQDPEYKNKCMKGNYKWATLKYHQIKANLAKRKGVSIEELKMPKIWGNKKKNSMEMNGNIIKRKNNTLKKNDTPNIKENAKNNYLLNKYSHSLKSRKAPDIIKKYYSQKVSNNNIILDNINSSP